ncbi:MAG: prepilin-type N-terminal cleavage/methylation domain-containing protein [Desulfobulbaceae bacterium]|nr:prepilin-type N-terminal cleavage/methylation domain-containing protein [Desulfobulbaceae bacterium]
MVKNTIAPNKSAGFTLLEMLIALTLISIVSTLAIPRMSRSVFFGSLKSSARTLTGFIADTKQQAIRKRTDYTLIFDLEHDIISRKSSTELENSDSKKGKQFQLPEGVTIQDILLIPGEKHSLGGTGLHFNTKGYSEEAYIHLLDDDGDIITIVVSPFLGVSDIFDSYVEPATL